MDNTEYKVAGRAVTLDKHGSTDSTKWEVTFKMSGKTVPYADVAANINPKPEMDEPRWQDNDGDGKWYEPGVDVNESYLITKAGEQKLRQRPLLERIMKNLHGNK